MFMCHIRIYTYTFDILSGGHEHDHREDDVMSHLSDGQTFELNYFVSGILKLCHRPRNLKQACARTSNLSQKGRWSLNEENVKNYR